MSNKPVRRAVTRSGKGIRGNFPSRKMNEMIGWESPIEAAAIRLFEFNVGVAAFYAQPSIESYHDASGTARQFVPDFRIDWQHGDYLLVEVKSDDDAAYPPTKKLLGLKAMAMQLQGKKYRVITEKEIKHQPRFENLELLERHAKLTFLTQTKELIARLDRQRTFKVRELAQQLGGMEVVFLAIADNALRTNLNEPLNAESLVWHPDYMEAGDGSFSI